MLVNKLELRMEYEQLKNKVLNLEMEKSLSHILMNKVNLTSEIINIENRMKEIQKKLLGI